MEPAIREKYNDNILREIMGKYGIDKDKIKLLDGFESFIYEFERDGREYILRISHTGLRRTRSQILAEVDYINYMADNGVPAARAVASLRGEFVETAENENPDFAAVAFEKAKGGPPQKHHWTPAFIRKYGEITGRMHRLTKEYKPSNPDLRRPDCMDDHEGFAEKFLPRSEAGVLTEWNRVLQYLRTLPRGRDEYGLIHQDLHRGNFFVDDSGNFTIFDFDDSQYFWFSHDIAMCLFYIVPHNCVKKEDLEKAGGFLKDFMAGYRMENQLEKRWLLEIPTFMKLREMDLYIAIHRSMDLNDLGPWCVSFMNGRKEKILNGTAYVDIDFNV